MTHGLHPAYFLKFANDNQRLIAYAPSVALNTIPERFRVEFQETLKRFNYISTRELQTANELKEITGRSVPNVLDPTLLHDVDFYNNLINYKYYHYIWRKGSLTQNTSKHFYQSKQLFIVEREKLNEKLREREGKNYGREYQGSLVLTKIQMAVSLSKCSLIHFQENYIKFAKYAMMKPVVEAYAKLELEKAPLKYKIPLYTAKKQWNSILFFLCFLINKLKIQKYSEE